ncbi:MAG: diphthamide synthesis protein [Candidatus Pacearchaeota archaeon]
MTIMINFEIPKLIRLIKAKKAKLVLLQFPDGLKPRALEIANAIESKTKARCFIWLGSCFGACDIPQNEKIENFDLIINFGHSLWPFNKKIKAKEL